jgi:hypothetical protein
MVPLVQESGNQQIEIGRLRQLTQQFDNLIWISITLKITKRIKRAFSPGAFNIDHSLRVITVA